MAVRFQGGKAVPTNQGAIRKVGQKLQKLGPEMAELERDAKAIGDQKVYALIKEASNNLFKAWQAMNAPGVRGEFE